MPFPPTRRSVIEEIAARNDEAAWGRFVADYWGPLCRFALRGGRLSLADAEDVTAETFVVLVRNRLLSRWIDQPTARLRTLLCSVMRNLLNNRGRVERGRAEVIRKNCEEFQGRAFIQLGLEEPSAEQDSAFHAAWVEELLSAAVELLLTEYQRKGQGDRFRVLYGRLCEGLTARQVADALGMSLTQSENGYKQAVGSLRGCLERLVRDHVERYSAGNTPEEEFHVEWGRLNEYLHAHGGLEQAVRSAYEGLDREYGPERKLSSVRSTQTRLKESTPSSG